MTSKKNRLKYLLSLAQNDSYSLFNNIEESGADDIYITPSVSIIDDSKELEDLVKLDKIKYLLEQDATISVPPVASSPVLPPTKTPAVKQPPMLSDLLVGENYQAPIKDSWYSSGGFSLTPTNIRHPQGHMGVDLRAPGGTLIYPMLPGVVTNITPNTKGGYVVNVDHKHGLKTYYAHCGTIKVQVGDVVDYNTPIATVGDSGNAKGTWPHLHFQVSKNGIIEDPAKYFNVPKYTEPTKLDKKWLSTESQEEASNFNIQKHIQQKTAYVKLNSNNLLKMAELYYSIASRL